jgi:hypothetical protein
MNRLVLVLLSGIVLIAFGLWELAHGTPARLLVHIADSLSRLAARPGADDLDLGSAFVGHDRHVTQRLRLISSAL